MYADGGGLYLQVGPTGAKSWIFRYMLEGRARAMGLARCIRAAWPRRDRRLWNAGRSSSTASIP